MIRVFDLIFYFGEDGGEGKIVDGGVYPRVQISVSRDEGTVHPHQVLPHGHTEWIETGQMGILMQ